MEGELRGASTRAPGISVNKFRRPFSTTTRVRLSSVLGQPEGEVKLSSRMSSPRPGCISGVGLGIEVGASVAVEVAGNQSIVAVGADVALGSGVEVASGWVGPQATSKINMRGSMGRIEFDSISARIRKLIPKLIMVK